MTTTNLVTNPRAFVDLTGWVVNNPSGAAGTGATIARGYSTDPQIPYGSKTYVRATFGTGATSSGGVRYTQPVTAGKTYSMGVWCRASVVQALRITCYWLDAGSNEVGSRSYGTVFNSGAQDFIWGRSTIANVVAPAGAVTMILAVYAGTGTAWPSGSNLYVTAALVVEGATVPEFFDGDIADNGYDSYGWNGAQGQSTSQHNVFAMPTVDVLTDWSPTPRCRITFGELPVGAELADIYRYTDSGSQIVPNGEKIGAAGGLSIVDYYAPLGSTVQYRAHAFDADENDLGFSPANAGLIPIYDVTIVQSPSDPTIFATVEMVDTAASDLVNPVNGQTYNLGDRRLVITETTQMLSGVDMGFYTSDDEQYAAVLALVKNDNGQICYRTPPPMLVPRVFYTWGQPHRQEFNRPRGLEDVQWINTVDEVSPPAANVIASANTFLPYETFFPTFAAFEAAYQNFLDAEQHPPTDASSGYPVDPTDPTDPTNPTQPQPVADGGFSVDSGILLLS